MSTIQKLCFAMFFVSVLAATKTPEAMAQSERKDIKDEFKWNTADLYATPEAWQEALDSVAAMIPEMVKYKGRIGESAQTLLEFMQISDDVEMRLNRIATYAHMIADEDLGNSDAIARKKKMEKVVVDYEIATAFARPELTELTVEKHEEFIKVEPKLEPYRFTLYRLARAKEHTLSPVEEDLLAKTEILGNTPYTAFGIFSNAELPWPTITLENGKEVTLNQSEFSVVRASANKNDREKAFYAYWNTLKKFEGTMGELMNGNIKRNLFSAQVRKYNSCLEEALFYNNIPVEVYHSLVENVNKNLPTFHRYLRLKQRLMGLDTLKYSDLYAPAVADVELHYTYEEAKQMVLDALEPLGTEYTDVVKYAFANRWIDVYPTAGKRSGAYSTGGAYDVHPYILMNFTDQYEQVGTLIHEMGHTMHSYFSNKTQPFNRSYYATFVAEVASTFNEALLDHLMLQRITDKGQRISLLMSILDGFKGTLFRQTQFAEFELGMHEMAERGEPITGSALSKLYGDIVRRYYGHDEGVCFVDSCIDNEWQAVPHFYMGFYVFQYSTSFVASQALSEKVLSGSKEATDRYLHFLTTGGSQFPIDILKDAGVDMTTSEPFDETIKKMNNLMDEIEKLLD